MLAYVHGNSIHDGSKIKLHTGLAKEKPDFCLGGADNVLRWFFKLELGGKDMC